MTEGDELVKAIRTHPVGARQKSYPRPLIKLLP
jgi:hypothetical protein